MFGPMHYVPILKTKRGEMAALKGLTDEVKKGLTPLLEITPPSQRSWHEHIDTLIRSIHAVWNSNPVFIDTQWVDTEEYYVSGTHPLEYIVTKLNNMGSRAIPVTDHERNSQTQAAVGNIHKLVKLGVCLRLKVRSYELGDLAAHNKRIRELLARLNLNITDADVILDFQSLVPDKQSFSEVEFHYILNALTTLDNCRSLTIAGSSFPRDLSLINPDSIMKIERAEWLLWTQLYKKRARMKRLPSFGDYAIAHPSLPDSSPFPNTSAQIRYTLDTEWMVLKGYGMRTPGKGGSNQFYGLAARLVSSGVFYGSHFSEGDRMIEHCANRRTGPGNTTTWRHIGTSHHLNVVVNQISKLAWP